MSQREDALKFETGRIKALQEERLHIQKKTFTKWMNSFLAKVRMEVDDLFVDLADGKKLLKLLEIISGEKLGKPNNGKMRVHKIENVNKSLAFLLSKVRLESIGAEDIVDGNPRLILGLLWTIILRFQIQEIEIDVDEENESGEKKSAKDALLLWCQRRTNGYNGVNIQDFTGSWRSGLGFNALIHAHRPDLIDFENLVPSRHIDNLNNAFDVAERDLGIPRLLDAEDIDTAKPDEKSVLTYVASYYHTFARMKNEMKGGRRIANIVGQIVDADKLKNKYELYTSDLMEWIRTTIEKLNDHTFPNSFEGIQKELLKFKDYRTIEKPPKYNEKSEIEVCYFNINTRLKELKQALYSPPEGKQIHDLEKAWQVLENMENRREVALREELLRQTHLEQLAERFDKKIALREGYLKDMILVLSDPRYGINVGQVEATLKKHEAISADILAREERCAQLTTIADYLVREGYHGQTRIRKRADEIMQTWNKLLQLLETHRAKLGTYSHLMSMLREIDTMSSTIHELEENFLSNDVGHHLLAVEDLLQKHSLLESQIGSMGETLKRLNRQGAQYVSSEFRESAALKTQLEKLGEEYKKLLKMSAERRTKLEDARSFFQFVQDHEEEEAWLIEKQKTTIMGISAKDLRAVISLQQKHKAISDEMKARLPKSNKIIEAGQELLSANPAESKDIQQRIESLQKNWKTLQDLVAVKEKKLKDAAEAYQFYADANEADSWILEKKPLVASVDYGEDESSAQALLQRHKALQSEITAYDGDIKALNAQAEKLIRLGISTLETQEPEPPPEEEWVQEQKLIPQEYWEEEPVERTEYKTVTEERAVPQVKALYQFQGQDIDIKKGEVMFLLNKTNNDWWNVRQANGNDGFVPANYVKEIEPKVVQVQARKPEIVREVRRVKKTKMVLQNAMVKKTKSPKPAARGGKRAVEENEPVEKRLTRVNTGYHDIVILAKKRLAYLEDAIRLFAFYKECDDFEKWIRDKEKMLQQDDRDENVESAKRKFEKFLTDLSASGKRIEQIDKTVEAFVKAGHSQMDKVRLRQKHIHQLYDNLNQLKSTKERSLEGASSVELFNRTCDEGRDWMLEKMDSMDEQSGNQIGADATGQDLKTVQALQRRHQNLEREVAPIEEKVGRVKLLGAAVKESYPHEQQNVNNRLTEIDNFWEKLKAKAIDRRARLEEAVGQQIFMHSSKSLLTWVGDTKETLKSHESAKDVSTAEALLKKHSDLGDDIRAHEDEFDEVIELGVSIHQRTPNSAEVADKIEDLRAARTMLHRGWQEKGNWLQQVRDLQVFIHEADHIDTATAGHNAFLDFENLGKSLDEVEGLLKRHNDFENTLVAQDERLKAFSEMGSKFIDAKHFDSANIAARRDKVLAKRQAVKNRSKERKAALATSLKYHEFKTDVDDMMEWIVEKTATASDESYKDLTNLERKLQKHEAFAGELRANEIRLRSINRAGLKLIQDNDNYRKNEIEDMLEKLNEAWANLRQQSDEKGNKLRQAEAQHTYYKKLESVREKLDEMGNVLGSKEEGSDRRACKEMLKKHQLLEADIVQWDIKIEDLVNLGNEMGEYGHFDASNISKQSKECQDRLNELKGPAAKRRRNIEEALQYFDFIFEVDAQLHWIKERLTAATSETLPQDLHQAQNLFKKHKKLKGEITGHEPMIQKTLSKGDELREQHHPQQQNIKDQCEKLKKAWEELQKAAEDRSRRLELALKAQQFFNESSEVEAWMNEKNSLLSSTDYGKDKDASVKFLTKHKGLELEMDSYNGLVKEMGNMAQGMVNAKHPDSKVINNKHEAIVQQMKNLKQAANERRRKLMESMQRHEYFLEAEEFEKWIDDQLQTARSEDYGQDYEHLLVLHSKFNDFKHRVDANSERFKLLDELAKKLISTNNTHAVAIQNGVENLHDDIPELVALKHEKVCGKWQNLLGHIEARDIKLHGAGEIHRFHRDVADALARIQEKLSFIPEGVGRDVNACEGMLRIHEAFENDLLALEAQLQVLVQDAEKLQSVYPTNAENIKTEQKAVVESWHELQSRAASKKDELEAACDFHRFSSMVRNLMNWAGNLQVMLVAHDKVRNIQAAQDLMTEHERHKSEIEAREENFEAVNKLGNEMIGDDHSASAEVREKLDILFREREKLVLAWEKKKIYLDQLIDLQLFLRDAKQLDSICSGQELVLANTDIGNTVEEVDASVKKHDAFEKLIATQDEKFHLLAEHGNKLIRQNHFESSTVKARIQEVEDHRKNVKTMSQNKRELLAVFLFYVQFLRDVSEAESWIDEKKKKLDYEASQAAVVDLESKIKKLKKHQAFEAELEANRSRIQRIVDDGAHLKQRDSEKSKEIDRQIQKLLKNWSALLEESKQCGKGLEEAQEILDLNNQVEKVEAWIREKELLVGAGDVGRDFEHCQEIQKKLGDVNSDMLVDDQRIKQINTLAEKLLSQHPNAEHNATCVAIDERRNRLNSKWKDLAGALRNYRQTLAGALEIHAFFRDTDDTKERINEKILLLASEDTGKDLPSVELLVRKQDTLDRDVSAISQKIMDLTVEEEKLSRKYPDSARSLKEKLKSLQERWDALGDACLARRRILSEAHLFHQFVKDVRDVELWAEDMLGKMETGDLPRTTVEAEALLQLHQERKAEIFGKQDNFEVLTKFGYHLIQEGHSAESELVKVVEELEAMQTKLNESCTQREDKLKQAHKLQLFNSMADEADSVLRDKDAFLANADLGDSTSAVESLIRKHAEFDKTMDVQLGRVEDLKKFANNLINSNHYSSDTIRNRIKGIESSQRRLKKASSIRHSKLLESKTFHQFLRNVHEVEGWILEKMQIAQDENYRDGTNLQSKIQKQQAFESELAANESRVSGVNQEGEGLLSGEKEHFAAEEILARLYDLRSLWRQLQDASALKRDRLHEAYQSLLFHQNLDDLEEWMDDLEQQLESEDHGKDLASVQHLLKKWQQLDRDFTNHSDQVAQIKESAKAFQAANHFLADEIQSRVDAVLKRYNLLQEPMHIRKENLEDALKLYQFLRDLDDELQWLSEKEPLVSSKDLGSSLSKVQALFKKHQALESEIQTHEPFVQSLTTRGHQMIRSNHFASDQVSVKVGIMQEQMSMLKEEAEFRKLRLTGALQSQAFYSETSEAETWMMEKRPYFASTDYGKDEDSVEALLKKLEVLERDLATFEKRIEKLNSVSQDLVERNHFDSENISAVFTSAKDHFTELQKLSDKRKQRLKDAKKLFRFLRESDEVGEWIQESMNTAGSEDYGRDVEHVEILIQKFEAFVVTMNNAGENRIAGVHHAGKQLLDEGHPEPEKVSNKVKEIQHMWEEFKELASARQEALAGAKQVHMFDRTADETIGWITEKDAAISTEDYGHDLESIQALVRKHQAFERDLAAVKDQVEAVVTEAKRLAELFPDAREHIEVKHEDTVESWNDLLEKAAIRRDKLQQAEQLQAYFDTYRELLAWVNETIAKVSAPELAKDVAGAEALILRHKEFQKEIDARQETFDHFSSTGKMLIREGHFLADEIEEKVKLLNQRWDFLRSICASREEIYEQNLDCQLFLRDVSHLDSWLSTREPIIRDSSVGSSIAEVEELIRQHDDFEKTIEAQADKLEALKRTTLIEDAFLNQQKKEEDAKREEAKRAEKERVEAIKRKEVLRITEERKREDERRRTQEIKINREDVDKGNVQSRSSEKLNESNRGHFLDPSHFFGSLRRGDVKRAESFKSDGGKKPKRTPSFTTRRRTQSFRRLKRMDNAEDMPPAELEGFLERKHELQCGGKKAALRSWKHYYVVLCGHLLCFFKDREDFLASKASSTPIIVYEAKCEKAVDYTKRKHVFRIKPTDGSEYLFASDTEAIMTNWITKISFHAEIPPSQQLMSFDSQSRFDGAGDSSVLRQGRDSLSPTQTPPGRGRKGDHSGGDDGDASSSSSTDSQTPDSPRRALVQPRSREPVYANADVLKDSEEPRLAHKPPLPPRTSSIESLPKKLSPDSTSPGGSTAELKPLHFPVHQSPTNGTNGSGGFGNGHSGAGVSDEADGRVQKRFSLDRAESDIAKLHDLRFSKTSSLPPGTLPPTSSNAPPLERRQTSTAGDQHRRRLSESSSESDSPASQKSKDKKSTGLMSFLRRKKATNL